MMETVSPLISIIIPVYKVEPYLRNCLDSIVNQTNRNLEIILVDDGSPDMSGDICDAYAAADERIIVIHQNNQGVSAARNAGLDIAKGDYILFVDSDDWIEQETCEAVLDLALKNNADLVCFRLRIHLPSGEAQDRGTDTVGIIDKQEMMYQLMLDDDLNSVALKLFSRNLFSGLRFLEGRYCEDMDIVYKLVHRSQVIYLTDAVLYHYYRHQQSLTSLRYQANSIKSRVLIFQERLILFQKDYPELVDRQSAMLMREFLLGKEWLRGDPDYPIFLDDYQEFMKQYRPKIKAIKQYNRLIGLYYYCRPLAMLYEKGRHFLYRKGYEEIVK